MKPSHPDSRVNIRPASLTDLPSLIALERQSASAAHWTEEQYHEAFLAGSGKRLVIVGETSGLAVSENLSRTVAPGEMASGHGGVTTILGFLIALQISPDWELENIVVDSEFRRKGIGRQLLNVLFAAVREAASGCVFLEVRESNSAARTLYESSGFEVVGRRKSYYSNPLEDAVLYRRPFNRG